MRAAVLAAGMACAPAYGADPPLDPIRMEDAAAAPARLAPFVATIAAELDRPRDQPLMDDQRIGYGVAWDERHVVVMAFVVEAARRVTVRGPGGEDGARVAHYDAEARVALLRLRSSVAELGLRVPERLSPDARQPGAVLWALTTTGPGATAMSGTLSDPVTRPEYGELLLTSLELAAGMPVFDARLRWVGLARTVAWDVHRNLLVSPEMVAASLQGPTSAPAPPNPVDPPERPWWAREPSPSR
jgi:hypothetical protein